jgi:hypothetical protein
VVDLTIKEQLSGNLYAVVGIAHRKEKSEPVILKESQSLVRKALYDDDISRKIPRSNPVMALFRPFAR